MESIVYAVDWSQVRENVIGGAAWFGGIGGSEVIEQLRRPTALICSSKGGDKVALQGGRKKRDELLMDNIRSSLAKGGSVLIPTDSSARVLELAWLLEKTWQEGSGDPILKNAKVYLASKSAIATMRHARSLLEWMDDGIVREFEGDEDGTVKSHDRTGGKQSNGQADKSARPFDFRHVKLVEKRSQFDRALRTEGSKVVLASDSSLEWGYSKLALREVSQKPENLIILTQPHDSGSVTRHSPEQIFWQWYKKREDGVAYEKSSDGDSMEQVYSGGRELSLEEVTKAPLQDKELQIYQQFMATQQQLQNSFTPQGETGAGEGEDAADDVSDSSESSDEDDEHQGRVLNASSALGHAGRKKVALSDEDLGVSILIRKKGVYDFDVRNKKGRNAVFPYVHARKRADELGEYIRPEDYLRAEEKNEQDGPANSKIGPVAGQKRKRDDSKVGTNESSNKRQQVKKGEVTEKLSDGVNGVHDESADGSDESEEEPEPHSFEGPAKAVPISSSINVNARLSFVDFTGIHDQRSLQMLIPLISPRKLVLTAGTKAETEALSADCRELLAVNKTHSDGSSAVEIFTPANSETVDVSVDTNAWVVKLSRNLVKRLQWQSVRMMNVVTVTGQLRGEVPRVEAEATPSTKRQKLVKSEVDKKGGLETTPEKEGEVDPILDVVPTNMAAASRSVAQPLHVGDMRLADLRRIMAAIGHSAEFRGEGTLLVDGNIAVRKLGTGKIVVEAGPTNAGISTNRGSNFQEVKRQIYAGLAVVAGGL